ncbi:unnamed protein product [Cuscuta campestris]|uniref:CCHC-type domain-containing protein n=1 Tax=Cuscuta campestris TaxID=132261 RepID=A0A484KJT5_9ASTE|nr:unnamed protein product [Cuscuta campestris]
MSAPGLEPPPAFAAAAASISTGTTTIPSAAATILTVPNADATIPTVSNAVATIPTVSTAAATIPIVPTAAATIPGAAAVLQPGRDEDLRREQRSCMTRLSNRQRQRIVEAILPYAKKIFQELKDQMASRMFNAGVTEGQSTTRPPLFDGTNYSYWKERMRIFIQSNDYKLWLIVKNSCGVPMKKVGEVNVPKTEEEFTDEDCKKMELNAKEINMIYCGVNADDYRKISRCETAKQMWEKLEVTYEGTAQVDAIEEGRDFQTTTYGALRGNLITYETTQLSKVVEEKSKRSIALPATTSTHNNVDDEDDDSDDTDLGLFVRKFKKMMLKRGAKKNTPPKCYGCGKIGHFKPMCPKFKNEKDKRAPKKQRDYISWENDGSGSEDSETEEVANLCLMAIEDGETSKENHVLKLIVVRNLYLSP